MIAIYGARGHAKVILEAANALDIPVEVVIDDDSSISELFGITVQPPSSLDQKTPIIIGIGDNKIRFELGQRLKEQTIASPIVHPMASHSNSCTLGNGTVVMTRAVINASAILGLHVIVNSGAIIEHDVHLSDYVHISPGATVTGGVKIGQGTHIGAGAVIIPNVTIGKWATIGAGTVVLKDVPDFATVVGVPGKIIKIKTYGEN